MEPVPSPLPRTDGVVVVPNLDFFRAEYDQRVTVVRREMTARGIELLILDQLEHLAYITGYLPTAARYQACLLPATGDPHMILRGLDEPVFADQSWVESSATFSDDEDSVA